MFVVFVTEVLVTENLVVVLDRLIVLFQSDSTTDSSAARPSGVATTWRATSAKAGSPDIMGVIRSMHIPDPVIRSNDPRDRRGGGYELVGV